MACVNVNRGLEDQFYRYKMPKIIAKVEGKGNGIKTVIVNMVEVAKSLNRPPMYPTKYFGCVLGAQVNCDAKNERYIVNGSHDSAKLQDLLDGFIKKYVLCHSCSNPETVLGCLVKKGIISTTCKACGYSGTINSKDKLTTFILKNPPNGESGTVSKKEKRDKKNKAKEDKNEKKSANGDSGNGVHDDSDEFKDVGNTNGDGEVDDDWCEDTTADAVKTRMNELTDGAKGLMLNDDLEKSSGDRHQLFFDFVQAKKACFEAGFDINTQKELMVEAERLDIRDKAVLVLCELLFNEKILQQIKTHRLLFLRFCAENHKSQKYLLRGFELTVKEYQQTLMPKVSHILKAFYDVDILDEKVILDWGSKVYKKTVGKEVAEEIHEKAAPFLKWLKEAEEEDSDEDEEEEEIEVVYDDRHRGNGIQQVVEKEAPSVVKKQEEQAADDIDIDAI